MSTRPDYSCTFPIDGGVVRAELPIDAGAEEKILTSTVVPKRDPRGSGTTQPATSFETRWNERIPPYNLSSSPTHFRFFWVRDCMYPADDTCPTATLLSSGLECVAENPSAPHSCVYDCAVSAGVQMPARIRFVAKGSETKAGAWSSAGDMSWEDAITGPNADLTSYVAADERVLPIAWGSFDGWPREELESIDLLGTSGAVHHLKTPSSEANAPPLNTSIRMPLGCNDSMVYEAHGVRGYWDGIATVRGGVLQPSRPDPVLWHVGAAALGGVDIRSFTSDAKEPDTRELIVAEVQVGFRPAGVRHVLDMRGGYAFTRVQYFDAQGAKHDVPYNRYHLYVGWAYRFNPAVELGTGAGVVLGHSLLTSNWLQAGGLRLMPWFGIVDATIYPWRFLDVGFQASPRLGAEPVATFDDTKSPASTFAWRPTLQLSLGIRFNRD